MSCDVLKGLCELHDEAMNSAMGHLGAREVVHLGMMLRQIRASVAGNMGERGPSSASAGGPVALYKTLSATQWIN